MRTLKHPWDWIGHLLWFGLMAFTMRPMVAVIVCAICLEIDQYWTWYKKGWDLPDTIVDLIFDAIGIILAICLKSVL